jgi:hypothetical protein
MAPSLTKIYRFGDGGGEVTVRNKAPKDLFELKVIDVAKGFSHLHASPHMLKMIKSRAMRWVEYMQSITEIHPYNILFRKFYRGALAY